MIKKRILIVGAGVAGRSLAKNLKAHGFNVMGFIDDNHLSEKIKEVSKLGSLKDVNKVVKENDITDIYFSIPSASARTVRNFINSVESQDVKISIIPRSFKVISEEEVSINDLKDVDILHLVGREPIKQDLISAKKEIQGKKILITGAAGSIGSELVKQVILLRPKRIICVDFWESGIFYLQHDIGNRSNVEFYVANIRERERMEQIFQENLPDYVFHAAAYKHVPLMQSNSLEAFNNNVYGSLNLVDLSIKYKVKSFVNVSTDKAVNPVNVMGTTKRIVEILLQNRSAIEKNTKISSVRFGNVLESNGSVVQVFKRQIDRGGPLTLTHEGITRFFMTKEEAAQLIIQSSILSQNGEIFVLDMGEPIKIMDLAKIMIRISRKTIPIKIIGLRPGEKMYEELYFDKKNLQKTRHEQVFILKEKVNQDHLILEEKVRNLIGETTSYKLNNRELINKLIEFGFAIKK